MSGGSRKEKRLRTTAVHAGEPRPPTGDALVAPIFQSATFLLGEPESFDDIRYIRLNNTPNQTAVSAKIAALEGTEAALVTPSGTAAVSMSLLAHLRPGDHVIAHAGIYGGTRKILDDLHARHGVDVSYVREAHRAELEAARTGATRVVFVESLTNPCLEIVPLDEVVAFARAHDLVSMIDNTFATPMGLRPATLGFDLVLHSATKYLNGHSDVVAGAIAGSAGRIEALRRRMNLLGVCLDPHACFLLGRGLKTLPVRVPAQWAGANALAVALVAHPAVRRVHYPGLPEDPGHERARRFLDGYGAIVTFRPEGGPEAAEALMHRLDLAHVAPSLGGLETLVCRPVNTSHAGLSDTALASAGVTADMIRVSVGIEDPEDLVLDFGAALDALSP
jgi:cystathionine beta-lyase/cystathionine gamma-synthase